MPDGTYAPQSPDLSSFLTTSSSPASRTTPQQQPGQAPQSARSQTSTYTPRSPNLSGFGGAGQSQAQAQASPPPLGSHRALLGAVASGQVYIPPQSHQQPFTPGGSAAAAFRYPSSSGGDFATSSPQQQNSYAHAQNSYLPQIPDLPPSHDFPPLSSPAYGGIDPARVGFQPQQPPQAAFSYSQQGPIKKEGLDYQNFPPPYYSNYTDGPADTFDDMSSRVKRERNNNGSMMAGIPASSAATNLGPSQGIEVRTKFPVARIKRIMQADEEVGKVAQVTPVAVSKALELFMISLVTKSAAVARQGNSKRITATHLKKAIEADEQFDFLGEIVARVNDHEGGKKGSAGAGGGVKKEEEEDSDFDDDDDDDGASRKKKKGRR